MEGEWSTASQGRILCQHYIIQRSLKAGAQLKKLKLLFHQSSGQVSDETTLRFLEIVNIMESLNPSIYDSCSSKLKVTMSTDEQVRWAYDNITSQLLQTGVTWGKVVSMFTVCGAIAADCVLQGHTEFLPIIIDSFEETCTQPVLKQYLTNINGWQGIIDHYAERIEKSGDNPEPLPITHVLQKSKELFVTISQKNDVVWMTASCLVLLVVTLLLSRLLSTISSTINHV